jgi:hypothetical protein
VQHHHQEQPIVVAFSMHPWRRLSPNGEGASAFCSMVGYHCPLTPLLFCPKKLSLLAPRGSALSVLIIEQRMDSQAKSSASEKATRPPRFWESHFRIVTIVHRFPTSGAGSEVTRTFRDYKTFSAVERWIERALSPAASVDDDGPRTFHLIVVNSDMIERHRAESLDMDAEDADDEPDGVDEALGDDVLGEMEPPAQDPTYEWDLYENVMARNRAARWRTWSMLSLFKQLGVYSDFVPGSSIWFRRGPRRPSPELASGGRHHRYPWCASLLYPYCQELASVLDISSQTTVALIRVSSRDFTVVESVLRNLIALSSPRFLDNPTTWFTFILESSVLSLSDAVDVNSQGIMEARANIGTGTAYHYYVLGEKKQAIMNDPGKLKDLSRAVLRLSEDVARSSVQAQAWTRITRNCRAASDQFVKRTATAGTDANPNVDVAMALEEIWEWAGDLFLGLDDTAKAQQWECDVLQQATQANIAQLSQEQSTRVANASWREATSVTTITVITLVFLPGTFTSVSYLGS